MQRKPIFDAVRRMLRRGFTQAEVAALDAAIERALAGDSEPRAMGPAGLALIKRWEGCARRRADGRFDAYPDPGTGGAPWTIGWGSTGPDVVRGLAWTQDQCDARLERDTARFAAEVIRAIGDAPTTQTQFDALVSFHYNTGAIARATLTKRHVAGDYTGAMAEFGKWINAGGKPLNGLRKRRADEATLYASELSRASS
ncbi:MAG: lysozyme [Novosphingobium sp.]|nr:lysozyme [Novosphingobium sp.]